MLKNKSRIIFIYIFFVFNIIVYPNSYMDFDEGVFIPSNFLNYEFIVKNNDKYKYVDYTTLSILFNSMIPEYGLVQQNGTMPCFIVSKTMKNNYLELKCVRLEPEYSLSIDSAKEFIDDNTDNYFILKYQIIDNDEIVEYKDYLFDNNIKHFYRISGPAKIPIQNAVINDSNVRLRVKPNLTCDTWALLDKGLPVKIKDKSKEKFEIDGESYYWYKVDNPNYPDGWVYGKYLDIENE